MVLTCSFISGFTRNTSTCCKNINSPTIGEGFSNQKKKRNVNVNFDEIVFDEYNWKNQKESEEELNDRISYLKFWLKNRKENNIAIIGHNSFFKKLLNINNDNFLNHCYPYIISI